jgi:hypothetical protein
MFHGFNILYVSSQYPGTVLECYPITVLSALRILTLKFTHKFFTPKVYHHLIPFWSCPSPNPGNPIRTIAPLLSQQDGEDGGMDRMGKEIIRASGYFLKERPWCIPHPRFV